MSLRYTALYSDLCDDVTTYLDAMGSPHSVDTLQLLGKGCQFLGITVDDLSVGEFACMALLTSVFKKFEDGHEVVANQAALDKFIAANLRCGEWKVSADRSLEQDLLLGLFKQEVYRFCNRGSAGHILGNLTSIVTNANVGPGASLGANGTDFYTKLFSSKLTMTRGSLYELYSSHFTNIPFWSSAENQRIDAFGVPEVVRGNRLSFVPKNVDTSRCICTEPSLNMFFQQGVKTILEQRLRQYFGIDLATQQECNRDLAQIGSKTGKFATIDLSSASDTVSLKMMEETFPSDFLGWLRLLRSNEVLLPDGRWLELKMISSMGNAFTFPLETMIFSCIVSAAYSMKDVKLSKGYRSSCEFDHEDRAFVQTKHLPNFGVFGDDIIVLEEHYRHTVMLLELLGFTVNADKSFSSGPFRESCGGDYFRGHPVRGVYIKTLKTQASRYVAINRLNAWSAEQGISLPRTIRRLMKSVRFLPVPLYENDDAGVKVPFDLAGFQRRDEDTQAYMYRRWESIPEKIAIKDGALKLPKGAKHRIYNGEGLLLAALRGDVRNDAIGSRLGPAKYRSKVAITQNWDWLPAVAGEKSPVCQRSLTDSIRNNLILG